MPTTTADLDKWASALLASLRATTAYAVGVALLPEPLLLVYITAPDPRIPDEFDGVGVRVVVTTGRPRPATEGGPVPAEGAEGPARPDDVPRPTQQHNWVLPPHSEWRCSFCGRVRDWVSDGPCRWPSSGAGRIHDERRRQVEVEGFDAQHDDVHSHRDLVLAARTYLISALGSSARGFRRPWPWGPEEFKPTTPLRDLEKAGALIAAAIDRLLRTEGGKPHDKTMD